MKHLFIVLSLLFFLSVSGQNINRKYSFMSNGEGSVYFINPQSGFQSSDLSKNRGLEYDITYVSFRDSVVYNFTYYNPQASPLDSAFIVTDGVAVSVAQSMIYIQPYKNAWAQRASFFIPNDFIVDLHKKENPYEIILFSKGRKYVYRMSSKDWKKKSAVNNKIFETIKYASEIKRN